MTVANTRMWFFALAFLATASAAADDRAFHGIVSHVFDGDSFVVRVLHRSEHEVEVRLMDIDAPEKDQPHADASRAALMALIDGRNVFIDVTDVDQYGRKVAKVYREPDRLNVARALVELGHVWVNRRFAKDRGMLTAEDEARARRAGLWSLPTQQMPPWEYRRARREAAGRNAR